MARAEESRWAHFCTEDVCWFLASSGEWDLWWHQTGSRCDVYAMAKMLGSSGATKVKAGLNKVGFDPELTEAFDRACAEGLVPPAIFRKHGQVADTTRAANQSV